MESSGCLMNGMQEKGHLKRQVAVDIRKKKIVSPLRNKIPVKNKTPD